jgi:hypothetical protein
MKTTLKLLAFLIIPSLLFGAAGDIKIDRKNTSNNAWISTIFSTANNSVLGTGSSGVPSLVTPSTGLTLSGGSLTINQAFSPTWTGAHTFSNASPITITSAGAVNGFQVFYTADLTNYQKLTASYESSSGYASVGTRTSGSGGAAVLNLFSQLGGGSGSFSRISLDRSTAPFFVHGLYDAAFAGSAASSGTTGNWFQVGVGTSTATSGTVVRLAVTGTYNHASGTADATDILVNRTQTAVQAGTTQRLLDLQVGGVTQFNVSNTGTVSLNGVMVYSTDTLSGAGAVSVTKDSTRFTSTGVAQALTLADGVNGQRKKIVHVVDGGSAILTPTTKTGFSTVTFTNVGETVTLVFYTTIGWTVESSYLAVVAP